MNTISRHSVRLWIHRDGRGGIVVFHVLFANRTARTYSVQILAYREECEEYKREESQPRRWQIKISKYRNIEISKYINIEDNDGKQDSRPYLITSTSPPLAASLTHECYRRNSCPVQRDEQAGWRMEIVYALHTTSYTLNSKIDSTGLTLKHTP